MLLGEALRTKESTQSVLSSLGQKLVLDSLTLGSKHLEWFHDPFRVVQDAVETLKGGALSSICYYNVPNDPFIQGK